MSTISRRLLGIKVIGQVQKGFVCCLRADYCGYQRAVLSFEQSLAVLL